MEQDYNFKSLSALLAVFNNDKSCRDFLEYLWWQNKPVCSSCGYDKKIYRFKNGRTFKCANCRRNFTITVGTVFHSTNISLPKWFLAIYIISSHKTGVSSHQMARHLGITQPNAWRILHKIRKVMSENKRFKEMLDGIVEADESYVGGKNKNRHWDKKFKHTQGRSIVDKAPVFGILQRNGTVKVWVLKSLNGEYMRKLIRANVKKGAIMCTDEYNVYRGLDKRQYYQHFIVDHSRGQHVVGIYHTNTIEGFWNFIKREIMGTYRNVSRFHLNKYAREAAYRYNTRKLSDVDRFMELLKDFGKYKVTCKEVYLNK